MKIFASFLVLLGGLMIQSAFSTSAHAAGSSVGAELVIPPAQTYVIGDSIPLYWRFTNRSTDPLAFMWEGCCRLNGRLDVSKEGQAVPPTPPGQTIAHMFAKAEVLAPGKARDFDTYLNDWVQLPDTGTYELHGRYTGVLDFQTPQVPRGVSLWRDAAETGTNQISVLSVGDYWKQRPQRMARRRLSVELSGPRQFPLLGQAAWSLRIRNTGAEPRTFRWPDDLALWVVNEQGFRETRVPAALDGDYAEITLPPGKHFTQQLQLDYSRMEGEPWGKYQLFIDLRETADGLPRVPSNLVPLHWRFTTEDAVRLVSQAASGSKAGLRNPALKFLRVYLAEFGPLLQQTVIPAADAKAVELLEELRLAAAIKAFSPQPGRKDWAVAVDASGHWQLADASVRAALGNQQNPIDAVRRLLLVKRHLGIDVGLTLQPAQNASAAAWFAVARSLAPVQTELAAPPHLRAAAQSTNSVGVINLQLKPVTANIVILLTRGSPGLVMRLARKLPEPGGAQAPAAFSPGDLKSMTPVTSPSHLLELINDSRLGSLRVQVFCPADPPLPELRRVLGPLWAKVNQVDLVAAP